MSDLTEIAKQKNVKLTSEIQQYLHENMESILDKNGGGGVIEDDLRFLERVKDWINAPLSKDIREKYPRIDQLEEAELFASIERQYGERLETLEFFKVIDDVDNPVIEGIDGNNYTAPTWDEILENLDMEAIGKLKNPIFILTPIAMSLRDLAIKVTSKNSEKLEQEVATCTWDIDADKKGELIYFPEEFKDVFEGMTKMDLLQQKGGINGFPGWQVTVMEGEQIIDREWTIKNKTVNADGEEEVEYKDANDFLEETLQNNLARLTPEEICMLHAEGVLKGEPFGKNNWEWLLGVCFKLRTAPPASAGWDSDYQALGLNLRHRSDSNKFLGARRAIRVLKK